MIPPSEVLSYDSNPDSGTQLIHQFLADLFDQCVNIVLVVDDSVLEIDRDAADDFLVAFAQDFVQAFVSGVG